MYQIFVGATGTPGPPSCFFLRCRYALLNVSGSTVFRSHPFESMLDLIRLYALFAAEMWLVSPVRLASLYVVAASKAVEDESANELLSSM